MDKIHQNLLILDKIVTLLITSFLTIHCTSVNSTDIFKKLGKIKFILSLFIWVFGKLFSN